PDSAVASAPTSDGIATAPPSGVDVRSGQARGVRARRAAPPLQTVSIRRLPDVAPARAAARAGSGSAPNAASHARPVLQRMATASPAPAAAVSAGGVAPAPEPSAEPVRPGTPSTFAAADLHRPDAGRAFEPAALPDAPVHRAADRASSKARPLGRDRGVGMGRIVAWAAGSLGALSSIGLAVFLRRRPPAPAVRVASGGVPIISGDALLPDHTDLLRELDP